MGATQGGEVRARWAWTEPAVWTERMLTALEHGVKGGVWFSLIDKVFAPKNLHAAWKRVEQNGGAAGVDRQTVEEYSTQAESNLKWLHEQLCNGTYQPAPVRRVEIPKPGSSQLRGLGIPSVRDRTVQGALKNVLEPIFEQSFTEHSYGFRPGRGCKDALRRVDQLLREGYTHVVDADIEQYFDRVDFGLMRIEIEKKVADNRVLDLIDAMLRQRVMQGMKEWTPTQGTPQGSVVSPLLSNIYLHPVDEVMRDAGFEMVRYCDDLVILCRSHEQAHAALELLTNQMQKRKLTLHPTKTRIVEVCQPGGFDFLGYHFERGRKTPRSKSMKKLRDRVRELTPRNRGDNLERIIAGLNEVLRGWFEYFKHCYWRTFKVADGFVRRRLRAILTRRTRRGPGRGIGAGNAHFHWPNAYFAKHGLLSLAAAHAFARQAR